MYWTDMGESESCSHDSRNRIYLVASKYITDIRVNVIIIATLRLNARTHTLADSTILFSRHSVRVLTVQRVVLSFHGTRHAINSSDL